MARTSDLEQLLRSWLDENIVYVPFDSGPRELYLHDTINESEDGTAIFAPIPDGYERLDYSQESETRQFGETDAHWKTNDSTDGAVWHEVKVRHGLDKAKSYIAYVRAIRNDARDSYMKIMSLLNGADGAKHGDLDRDPEDPSPQPSFTARG